MVDNSATGWKEGDGNLMWWDDPRWQVNKETCISIFNQTLETSSNWHLELRPLPVSVPGGIWSLSVFGFCLPNPSERVGWTGSISLCVGRRLTEAPLPAHAQRSLPSSSLAGASNRMPGVFYSRKNANVTLSFYELRYPSATDKSKFTFP